MTDVGKRDAMSISSLLSEPAYPGFPSEQQEPREPHEPVNGHAGNGQATGNQSIPDVQSTAEESTTTSRQTEAEIMTDDANEDLESLVDSVPTPSGTAAGELVSELKSRLGALHESESDPARLSERLNGLANTYTAQAQVFVAHAYPKLAKIAEQRVRNAPPRLSAREAAREAAREMREARMAARMVANSPRSSVEPAENDSGSIASTRVTAAQSVAGLPKLLPKPAKNKGGDEETGLKRDRQGSEEPKKPRKYRKSGLYSKVKTEDAPSSSGSAAGDAAIPAGTSSESKRAPKRKRRGSEGSIKSELPSEFDEPESELASEPGVDYSDDDDVNSVGTGDYGFGAGSSKRGKDETASEKRNKKVSDEDRARAATEQRRARQYKATFDGIWRDLARKEIPKAHKMYVIGSTVKLSNCRKTATLAAKEARKWQVRTNRNVKDMQTKARRAMREMMSYWKRNEKEERDSRKKAEKVALDSARKQEEEREALRQSRKLNFLITQTELYSHFVGSKTGSSTGEDGASAGGKVSLDFDNADDESIRAAAEANAQSAVALARDRASAFDDPNKTTPTPATTESGGEPGDDDFQNPESLGDKVLVQPRLLSCQLKEYQIKGLTWLANLYEQGINGILADEMGLGKTVQSISVMAYLAEQHNIWGPFLVVAPASTLHNWQQEITKFVPEFKVLPYWGSNKDRKVLRKFWDRKQLRYTKDSPFHVLVTSYQLVVSDAQYFNRIKWQYMILDEAQAIKSSSSTRWKSLLSMQCRNRLLLTGTPIQNSMQELWALLHFIMPTLFDSHEEFSDWFSKDIESHATKNKELNEAQLKRLHMILKPFMLRRVKKHVQQELGDKIEIDVYCTLTPRQRMLYRLVKSQVSIRDLIETGTSGDDQASLMNLVMQFRKVCNHPDLFERQDVISAFSFASFGNTTDYLRETNQLSVAATARNPIEINLPRLMATESGVLSLPGPKSDAAVRQKVLNKFVIALDPVHSYTQTVAKLSGTPAAQIVRTVQQNLVERALDLPDYDELLHMSSSSEGTAFPAVDLVNRHREASHNFGLLDDYVETRYIKELDPAFHARATAPPVTFFAPERSFFLRHESMLKPPPALFPLTLNEEFRRYEQQQQQASRLRNHALLTPGYLPDVGRGGMTTISVPSQAKFIADSGKLKKLDELLVQLKRDDHRVLVYFQMTRMMDLMEEYLTYRQYKYLRLDGSSKLGDRRDLVNDWQTRPELFVFLLSTRAGGLGINLTAADTVVFFDSDWNPTIDSQAMDRAHRLGQTKQVTVYRLLVRGTIEERMRNRAKQKEQVQTVVMEGTKAAQELAQKSKTDQYGKDVAFWLLDDDNEGV